MPIYSDYDSKLVTWMQIEPSFLLSVSAALFSIAVSVYLLFLWSSYPNRLMTDLPLLFGLSFAFQGLNSLVQALIADGSIPDTLEVLRLRAIVVLLTVLPMFVATLVIWAHRYRRYHRRAVVAFVSYWLLVDALAPTQAILLGLLIPLMMVVLVVLLTTFIVTWRTGRLKEVRSDLMALALVLIVLSQAVRVPLLNSGLSYVPVLINAVATILAISSFVIPRLGKGSASPEENAAVVTAGAYGTMT